MRAEIVAVILALFLTPLAAAQSQAASVTLLDQTVSGTVVVAEATLPEGGYVVLHNESLAMIGHSMHLEAGSHADVRVDLMGAMLSGRTTVVAMLHHDDGDRTFNGTGDRPYLQDGELVTSVANVTWNPQATPTGTTGPVTTGPGATTSPGATTGPGLTTSPGTTDGTTGPGATTSPTTVGAGRETDGGEDNDTPGIGVVALLAALGIAFFLARRT